MHTEIELKLLIDSANIPQLLQHPLLKSACKSGPLRQKLHSIYFDTPDLELMRQRIALRLRQAGGHWIQTVKGSGNVEGGLHQRPEWEVPVTGGMPDFDKLSVSPWHSFFTPDIQNRLIPIFVTDFWRTIWLMELPNGLIELALDAGEIQAKNKQVPICEVELELKSGAPASLFDLARELRKSIALQPEDRSKADRGYKFYSGYSHAK
ncbi:Adenylate cyclase [Candidatus Nitrotoga sp. 1052]|nr:Adenylate cyclase [Candidatus Nitrotoga sp. 1052]